MFPHALRLHSDPTKPEDQEVHALTDASRRNFAGELYNFLDRVRADLVRPDRTIRIRVNHTLEVYL